ncbi:Mas-related G-protein coupled receptor member X2, partial [Eschrichtius robustus]|nr:Mas-related G-protein coupled receptor member X2 [Eschrichtius robustus]
MVLRHDMAWEAEWRSTSGGFLSLDPTTPAWETELTPMNRSDQALPQTFSVATLTLVLLMMIIALEAQAGNAVVLWLLGFHLHRNAFSIYILNLGGADFVFLCCHIIGSLEKLITSCHSSSSPIPSFFTTVLTFAYLTGLSFLSDISTEHCLSDLCPIWYRCHHPKRLSAIMCALLWALALLLSTLEGKYCGFLLMDFNRI